jgi:hypothetical protein
LIVLTASASVLFLALAFIYLPIVRQRWILGAIACVLAGLVIVYPAPALLLAQAALLGLIAAALAGVIARIVARPAPWRVVVASSGSARLATSRPDSAARVPAPTTDSTSPTVSLRAPVSK